MSTSSDGRSSGLRPPLAPALARDEHTVPTGEGWAFEPKLDGWRGLLWSRAGVLQSRSGKDLAHRFPEIVTAARELGDVVLDGELVALREGRLDFPALAAPGSAAARRAGVNVFLAVFDLLAAGTTDLRGLPYRHRRERLERLLTGAPAPLQLVPMTTSRAGALSWMSAGFAERGIEGVVAKPLDSAYRAGRTSWVKVRHKVLVDARVIGVTGTLAQPDALVLARPDQTDQTGALRAVGLSVTLRPAIRAALAGQLRAAGELRVLPAVVGGLPGHRGTQYLPVHPTMLVEVEADTAIEFGRFRHRPRVVRIRDEP